MLQFRGVCAVTDINRTQQWGGMGDHNLEWIFPFNRWRLLALQILQNLFSKLNS